MIMLKRFFKSLDSVLYVQLQPDRVKVRFLRYEKETIEHSDVPWVAIVEHPKRGKQVIAVGSEARTIQPELQAEEELILGNGFEHPRSIIDNFEWAEIVVRHFVRQSIPVKRLLAAPVCFIQVLGAWEGGLTRIEKRAIHDLAMLAGAREVIVIDRSDRLTDDQIWALYDQRPSYSLRLG
jgi:rod shape-determining protein MreB and related proteins